MDEEDLDSIIDILNNEKDNQNDSQKKEINLKDKFEIAKESGIVLERPPLGLPPLMQRKNSKSRLNV